MSEPSATDRKRKRSMSNEELVHLASSLFGQASIACIYWTVLRQFMRNVKEYKEEMECSCAFYNITFKALVEGVFMYLARMYEDNGNPLTLRTLLNELEKTTITDVHPELQRLYFAQGQKITYKLKAVEECHFPEEVEETKKLLASGGLKYRYTTVELTLAERIHLFRQRMRALKRPINNLCQQRNKMLAHNDAQTHFDYEHVIAEYSIENADIHALVDFALDLSRFTYEMLTNEVKNINIVNIDDWDATLRLVRVGLGQMTKPIVLSGKDGPDDEPEECI